MIGLWKLICYCYCVIAAGFGLIVDWINYLKYRRINAAYRRKLESER